MAEKWIQKAIKKPGALRKSLGVKKGETIPAGKLEKAAEKGGKMGQRARFFDRLELIHFFLPFFAASRLTEYAIATACFGGLPAAISALMFLRMAFLDADLTSGITFSSS